MGKKSYERLKIMLLLELTVKILQQHSRPTVKLNSFSHIQGSYWDKYNMKLIILLLKTVEVIFTQDEITQQYLLGSFFSGS